MKHKIIPMIGLYGPNDIVSLFSSMIRWHIIAGSLIVYVRLHGNTLSTAKWVLTQIHNEIKRLNPIMGFEAGAGYFDCTGPEYFAIERWREIAELVRYVRRLTKRREVVLVNECPATAPFGGSAPIPGEQVYAAFRELSGLNCWLDIPVPHSDPLTHWIEQVVQSESRWAGLFPRLGFHWIAANNGCYDTATDPDGVHYRRRQSHITMVGKRKYMDRLFVSRAGRYPDNQDSFSSDPNFPVLNRNLKMTLARGTMTPTVVLYPGQDHWSEVANDIAGW